MTPHAVVITGVRSRTHLVYLASYLRRLLDEHPEGVDVGYVGGGRMLGHATVDEDDVTELLPSDARLRLRFLTGTDRWLDRGTRELTYLSVGAPGLKPWLRLRGGGPLRRIAVVVTDEGLGSYGDWNDRRLAWRRQGAARGWSTVRSLAVTSGARVLTTRRWALYRDTPYGWQVEPAVAEEFYRWARRGQSRTDGPSPVVLLTQPWVEIGVVSEAEHRRYVETLAEVVAGCGLHLAIRPHPAEHPARYREHTVMASDQPAELDPEVVDAAAVVGGLTTALVNLAALHHTPAVRHNPTGLVHLEHALSGRQRSLVEQFTGSQVPVEDLEDRIRSAATDGF